MRPLFVNKKSAEDRTLIRVIDKGMYDLCVDTGDEVIQVTDEVGFEKSRAPNTKFVMRMVLTEEATNQDFMNKIFSTYTGVPVARKRLNLSKGPLELLLIGMIFLLRTMISLADT